MKTLESSNSFDILVRTLLYDADDRFTDVAFNSLVTSVKAVADTACCMNTDY